MYGGLSIWLNSLSDFWAIVMLVCGLILSIIGNWLIKKHPTFVCLPIIGVILWTGIIARIADNTYQQLKDTATFVAIIPLVPIIFFVFGIFIFADLIIKRTKDNKGLNTKSLKTKE